MTCSLNQVLNHIILLAWNSKLQKQESLATKHSYTSFHHPTLLLLHPFIPPLSFILSPLFAFFFWLPLSHLTFFPLWFPTSNHANTLPTTVSLSVSQRHAHASGSISYILCSVSLSPEIPIHSCLVPHIPPLCLECIHHFMLLKCKHVVWIPKHFSRMHVGLNFSSILLLVFVSRVLIICIHLLFKYVHGCYCCCCI